MNNRQTLTYNPIDISDDPLWYKDAIIYEVHVRAFFDADNDGVGDFKGMTQKLDYLQQLGVSAIWLLPFYPSPLRDDGYDIADYYEVHPLYGTLRDFKVFLREAHKRGLRVITELVINHTSDQHPWFQRARKAKPGSSFRNFYVWSDTPEKYKDTRIIFKDFETSNWTYDSVAKSYYWHRFYSHQPDLNFDNPALQKAILQVMDFWFDMGVDGLRLDAVPYLYEREGTDCENLGETHEFLKKLRSHLDKKYQNRLFLAEANQWPEDAAAYFGEGDECHMNFHFPLMPRLFMAIRREDRSSIIDILDQTPDIPDNAQWALFLRNHDELTLEMVTDEERDYMYRVYADDRVARINLGIRRRLAALLRNDRRRIELMYSLLFSLPGTPVLYYGDEMGMGDNIHLGDRNGVRTPMQWSADRNAGFSKANPQSLYLPVVIDPEFHYESVNVEAQEGNSSSLLLWTRRIINLRKRFKAFGRGSIEFLQPDNRRALVFVRELEDEKLLVVSNLSRYVQHVEIDLAKYKGLRPYELFGNTAFPEIQGSAYSLTLGPHSFYWFELRDERARIDDDEKLIPVVNSSLSWRELSKGNYNDLFEPLIYDFIKDKPWFQGKNNNINKIDIQDSIRIKYGKNTGFLLLARVGYSDAETELYLIPAGYIPAEEAVNLLENCPQDVIGKLVHNRDKISETGYLYDLSRSNAFALEMLDIIKGQRTSHGSFGKMIGKRARRFSRLYELYRYDTEGLQPEIGVQHFADTIFTFHGRLSLKLYRKLEEGVNSDIETSRYLTERIKFPHSANFCGSIEYREGRRFPIFLGKLEEHVPNQGSVWGFAMSYLNEFVTGHKDTLDSEIPEPDWKEYQTDLEEKRIDSEISSWMGESFHVAQKLGQRSAEMHIALGMEEDDLDFAAEPFTPFYRRSLYQSMRNLVHDILVETKQNLPELEQIPVACSNDALLSYRFNDLLDKQQEMLTLFYQLVERNIHGSRIRIQGNFYLDQVLFRREETDMGIDLDLKIVNFSGEPARSLEERRLKRSPLRDVASMLNSLHYAAGIACMELFKTSEFDDHQKFNMSRAAAKWSRWSQSLYLGSYLHHLGSASFIREMTEEELKILLILYKLDRAMYELGYELKNRTALVPIPLAVIHGILEEERNGI